MNKPFIVLDRDGVINQDSDHYIKSSTEFVLIPQSIEAICQLSQAGYTVVIATNQSGLGRGLFQHQDLMAMHHKLYEAISHQGGKIAGIYFCPHQPNDDCSCRKPKAGLLDQIEQDFNISLKEQVLVGDSLRDLEAGLKKGCQLFLVKTGKGEKTLAAMSKEWHSHTQVFDNLYAVAQQLLN